MDGFRVIPGPARRWAERAPTAALALAGAGGTVLVVALTAAAARAGFPQDVTLPDWWGRWPTGTASRPGWAAVTTAMVGALCVLWAVLARGWLHARAPRPRTVALLALLWSLPLLPTGPMGSLDVQSYAAVGRLASLGLDPYTFGPVWLSGSYAAAVSPVWLWTPTPYGPVQIELLHQVAHAAGGNVTVAVLLIRLLAVVALAAAVVLAMRAAPERERSAVLLLVALNPLILVHVVSGAHLDVLVGLLALVVVMLTRAGRPVAAMVAAVIACQVKLPGLVLVAYVALDVLRRTTAPQRRRLLAGTLGAGALTAAGTWVVFPNAFGWLGALDVPGAIRSAVAPSTWVSYAFAAVTGRLDERGLAAATTAGRLVVALAGAAVVLVLLWRATRTSAVAKDAYFAVGWALIAVAFAGPVMYPWYVTWGLFAAAVGSAVRGRLALLGLSTVLVLVSGSTGGLTVVLVIAATLAAAAAVLWRTTRRALAAAPEPVTVAAT